MSAWAASRPRWRPGVVTLVLLIATLCLIGLLGSAGSQRNLYVMQASAFLHGHAYVSEQADEVVTFAGRLYVPFPPFPAILLMPFVAVLGAARTNVTLVALALTLLNVVLLMRTLRRLKLSLSTAAWIAAAFFLGTAYWMALARSGGVWLFAHIVAVTGLLLAVHEALGHGRGLLVGMFLSMAFLSRQMTIAAGVFLLVALWEHPGYAGRRARAMNLAGFALTAALGVACYLAFNWVRFGNVLDTGYSYIQFAFMTGRFERFGLFHPAYVPFNLSYMFLQGFHIQFQAPDYLRPVGVDLFGTSITFASPFLFAAFWARWKKPLLVGAWLSILLPLIGSLFYLNNGYLQINAQRFTLDFWPILILLVALGVQRLPARVWKGAIVYAIGLNVLAWFVIPLFAA